MTKTTVEKAATRKTPSDKPKAVKPKGTRKSTKPIYVDGIGKPEKVKRRRRTKEEIEKENAFKPKFECMRRENEFPAVHNEWDADKKVETRFGLVCGNCMEEFFLTSDKRKSWYNEQYALVGAELK